MQLLTAVQADRAAACAAAGLAALGLAAGDRVVIVTPELCSDAAANQSRVLSVILGALRSGVLPVLASPMLTPAELTLIVTDSRTRVVVRPEQLPDLVDFRGSPPDMAELPLLRPMHYTSGTTGRPKGVTADLDESEARAWWLDEVAHWEFDASDVTLVHSPLCHSAPLRFALGTLLAGGTVATAGRFDPHHIARAVREFQPTTAFAVPSQLRQLQSVALPDSSYRLLAHAGSTCPDDVRAWVHQWAGTSVVHEFLGSTEGQFTSCSATEWLERPGTIGRAREGRALSIDATEQIWCHPPHFARFHYFNQPDATAAAWRDTSAGPSFTVGDLGRLDQAGYLYLAGRREDLIITGGVNVYPTEVERVLAQHPEVVEAAVFGVTDARWGQRVVCALVADVDPIGLTSWARQRLAAYKVPKQWLVATALPRNSMGKVDRLALADSVSATASTTGTA